MKAVLDHIGIAVEDIDKALAFYRDALGLDVEAPEDVPTERVRARSIPVGGPALELLEATAPDSPIATYIEQAGSRPPPHDAARRGPSCRAGATEGSRRSARRLRAAAGRRKGARRVHPPVCGARRARRAEAACRPGREARRQAPHLRRPAADHASRRPVQAGRRRDVRRRAAAAVGEADAARRSESHSAGDAAAARRGVVGPDARRLRRRRQDGAKQADIYALDRDACTSITRWPTPG